MPAYIQELKTRNSTFTFINFYLFRLLKVFRRVPHRRIRPHFLLLLSANPINDNLSRVFFLNIVFYCPPFPRRFDILALTGTNHPKNEMQSLAFETPVSGLSFFYFLFFALDSFASGDARPSDVSPTPG